MANNFLALLQGQKRQKSWHFPDEAIESDVFEWKFSIYLQNN